MGLSRPRVPPYMQHRVWLWLLFGMIACIRPVCGRAHRGQASGKQRRAAFWLSNAENDSGGEEEWNFEAGAKGTAFSHRHRQRRCLTQWDRYPTISPLRYPLHGPVYWVTYDKRYDRRTLVHEAPVCVENVSVHLC